MMYITHMCAYSTLWGACLTFLNIYYSTNFNPKIYLGFLMIYLRVSFFQIFLRIFLIQIGITSIIWQLSAMCVHTIFSTWELLEYIRNIQSLAEEI